MDCCLSVVAYFRQQKGRQEKTPRVEFADGEASEFFSNKNASSEPQTRASYDQTQEDDDFVENRTIASAPPLGKTPSEWGRLYKNLRSTGNASLVSQAWLVAKKVGSAPQSSNATMVRSALHKVLGRRTQQGSVDSSRTNSKSIETEFESALRIDWRNFDWNRDCLGVYEGSMKVVGCLKAHPRIALASVKWGTGEHLIQQEINTLIELEAKGVRTVPFCKRLLEVPSIQSTEGKTTGYLLQFFDEESCFIYEEGERGTEDHVMEPMRKLKLIHNDEGDWTMNRDTIRVLKESKLEMEFAEDLKALVKVMLDDGVRIKDLQGILGKDGHYYVADPLGFEQINQKVNKNLLEGVFMCSINPKRENKRTRAAFVEGLGIDLGLAVPDES